LDSMIRFRILFTISSMSVLNDEFQKDS